MLKHKKRLEVVDAHASAILHPNELNPFREVITTSVILPIVPDK